MTWTRSRRVVPVDDTTVDLRQQALDLAANRLLRAQARIEATLALLARLAPAQRHRGVEMTQDQEVLVAVKSELFELHEIVTGKAK